MNSSQQFNDQLLTNGNFKVVQRLVTNKSSKTDPGSVKELSQGNLTKQDLSSGNSDKSLNKRSQMQQLKVIEKPKAKILRTSHEQVPSRLGAADYEESRQHVLISNKFGNDFSRPTSRVNEKKVSRNGVHGDKVADVQYSEDLAGILPFNNSEQSITNEE